MNIYPYFTNVRSFMAYRFSTLRMRALRDSLWAKLIGKNAKLKAFPERVQRENPNRKLIGIKDIPVEQIVGALGRRSDFDHRFRPLKNHLRDRWVNTYLTLESDGWSPILVHKVGDDYYVEDGHHRVSVARSLGMAFVQAQVWEYPSAKKTKSCLPVRCPEKGSAKAYVVR